MNIQTDIREYEYEYEYSSHTGLEEKDDLINERMNESVTKVFVEQPRLHRVC